MAVINWTFDIIKFVHNHPNTIPTALIVSSLNMLVQILFSMLFGADHVPKLRGRRG